MVNFLRIPDLFRFIVLFVLLLALRIPFFVKGIPITIPQLEWFLVGQKLASGFTMYRDVWFELAPFSAGFYGLLVTLFGRSYDVLYTLSLILVFLQAFFFNYSCNKNHFFSEKTALPACFYILFSSIFFDLYTLPPVLLALSFLLPAFHLIVIQIRFRQMDEHMLNVGLLLALATLFYLPSIVFLFIFVLSLILYSSGELRKYLLLLTGFLLLYLLVLLYYFWQDALDDLLIRYFQPYFLLPSQKFIPVKLIGILSIVPVIASLSGISIVSFLASYVNFQYTIFKLMFLWSAAAFVTLLVAYRFSPFQLYFFVPVFTYFTVHFYLLFKKKIVSEVFFWLLFFLIPFIDYQIVYDFSGETERDLIGDLIVHPTDMPTVPLSGKKILVVGDAPSLYRDSRLATPYLSWNLAQKDFLHLNNYEVLARIYRNFENDLPEVIIDREQVMNGVFYRIPILSEKYRKLPSEEVWVLKQ